MSSLADRVTVVIPTRRTRSERDEQWLRVAIGSIPKGVRYMLGENDGPQEIAEAVNACVEAAETEYCMILGADDALGKDCLDFLTSLCWDSDVTYPTLVHCDENEMKPIALSEAKPFCRNRLLTWNYVPGGAVVRRSAFLAVGGIDGTLEHLEDWDCWVRMARAGARFKAVPEARYLYRDVADSRNKGFGGMDPGVFRRVMTDRIIGERPAPVATFIYQASFVTTYYRCLMPASRLPAVCWDFPSWPMELEENDKGEATIRFPETHGNAVVFQFPGDVARRVAQLELQERGHRVLVEVDDNYTMLGPLASGWGKRRKGSEHSPEGHKEIVAAANGVIVTGPYLEKIYRKLNEHVYVCPNQIAPEDWPEEPLKPTDGVLRVGWFASMSHQNDEKLVRRALEWCSKQPGVEVVTMGYDPGWRFRRRHIPWTNDVGTYRVLLGQLDIGLAPIVPDPWSQARSDLKALEYGMAGVCPVLSDVISYRDWTDGVGCRKARDAKEFLHIVKDLVHNRALVKELAAECRSHVLGHRLIDQHVWRWQEAIDGA